MHSYYNAMHGDLKKWVNYNDLTFFNFQVVCEEWSKIIFERPMSDFRLSTNFEVGLNIELEQYLPFEVIARYLSYTTTTVNEFYTCPPYNWRGKPIQRACFMSDYKLKFYDKSKQAEIAQQGILRYEVVYNELRKIRKVLGFSDKAILTLQQLNDLDAWQKFFNTLLDMYDAIKKIPLITDEFPIKDVNQVYGYSNKLMADDIRHTMNLSTYKKVRSILKKVYDNYNNYTSNYHQVVRQKLISKYNSLIYVPQFQPL